MPSKSPPINAAQEQALRQLGEQIRKHRKKMKISSVTTAESAGMSRVTLYRIEQGEASVAIGAYMSVIHALGLTLEINYKKKKRRSERIKLPDKIRILDYKQLKRLAWQLKGEKEITLKEALDIYERNWRHLDMTAMDEKEKDFLEALLAFFGRERLLV